MRAYISWEAGLMWFGNFGGGLMAVWGGFCGGLGWFGGDLGWFGVFQWTVSLVLPNRQDGKLKHSHNTGALNTSPPPFG